MNALNRILRPRNPFTLETSESYPVLDFDGIQKSVEMARSAFSVWRGTPVSGRVAWIREALGYFDGNRDRIAEDITAQMGKPLRQSENEVKGFFERAEYLLNAAESALAPDLLPKEGFVRRIEHEPLGVVLIIAPWNYPLLTAANGVLTALLSGNTVILKHSPLTPAVGNHFAQALGILGRCENVLQSIQADHADIDRAIETCAVDHVVLTGSVAAGRIVQKHAAARGIQCHLELGGKDAAYVAEDADIAKAAEGLVDGALYNAGQSCCGIERVYVHRNAYADFVARCKTLMEGYRLGDPRDSATHLGPLARAEGAGIMEAQVQEAVAGGAKTLAGGKIRKIGKGVFFEPTLLIDVNDSMAVMREENFGPILPVMAVADDEEALRRVNDSRYGLTCAIYTSSLERAERFARGADTGTVFMNRCDYLDPALPWTGIRDSGHGASLSKYGFYGFTRTKSIHFRLG